MLIAWPTPAIGIQVMSTCQSRQRVQNHDDIAPLLNLPSRVRQRLLNDTAMFRGGLIEARGIHAHMWPLQLGAPLRDLFRTLIDEAQKDLCLRMIRENGGCRLAQNRRLARLWWSHHEGALPKTERHKQIDQAR